MRRTTLAALCIAAAATATLTGCLPGTDKADSQPTADSKSTADSKPKEPFAGLTGGEIAERAMEATKGASSLRMTGEVQDDQGGGRIQIDMALNKKGDCAGTLSMDSAGKAELIKTGDTLYLKYDEDFLRAQGMEESDSEAEVDGVVDMLAGKWTKMSTTGSDTDGLADFCDLDSALSEFEDVDSDAERGETTTVDGTPAIVLTEREGKDRNTAYVATEGKPYLLRVVSKSAKDPGDVIFSDYNKPVPAEAPKGKVLDLDAMGG
ncbi:hypothetical protein E0500_004495 [Streptomyces sp. KM273126]|uniref:hypothetical protein n=1 Tax=Streptomyces sp. KM273126 TaxID=2545247 RepID=UPI00103EA683|nr:hypothetical protein [Streptomyces sp. KM273126]MBA2806731.1 hypothetical protein [Streptomyces sp. KM273126]